MNWLKRLFAGTSRPIEQTVEDEAAIASLRSRVAPFRVSALHLRSDPASPFSRLGGLPLMPAGLEWPEWKGKPQAFLAQIDLAEANRALASFLPSSGRLYFFYDQDQGVWGFDPKDRGGWRVLFTDESSASFTERPAPAGMDPDCLYQAKPVSLHRIEALPDSARLPKSVALDDDDSDTYFSLREEAFAGMTHHQMLGFPIAVQNDDMEDECQLVANGIYVGNPEGYRDPRVPELRSQPNDWKLLLQLDSDDDTGWMWGDVGTLYFWVRESDAQQRDFSKVWMIFQCS
jgi:uncharacterized protein YwqG